MPVLSSKTPDFRFESRAFAKGFHLIGGVDEVGRGCFAGPVVAGCVVFRKKSQKSLLADKIKINDSKKLTRIARERADAWIKKNCIWGIGTASTSVINRLGISKATQIAFRKAIKNANTRGDFKMDFLLIDAFYIPFVRGLRRRNQNAIIKGDSRSYSIAAASIIAKVYRDGLMQKIGKRKRYKKYHWDINKGYGTKSHREAILKYGITSYHRKKFVETFLKRI